MITGIVTTAREAVISLTVHGLAGQAQEIQVVIDTGFDGSLTLPPALIAALGLPWRRRGRALLADGNESVFDIYEATVMWDGNLRRISVDEEPKGDRSIALPEVTLAARPSPLAERSGLRVAGGY